MPRVLIVDDSATAREALRQALSKESDIEVVGAVATGREAVSLTQRLRPDLITMDVHLRGESGLDITREIMSTCARPILVVTGVDPKSPLLAYQAMGAGALEVIAKLPGPTEPDYETRRMECARLVRTLSKVPVVHKRGRAASKSSAATGPLGVTPAPYAPAWRPEVRHFGAPPGVAAQVAHPHPHGFARPIGTPRIIVIGASTGGPPLLEKILKAIPSPYPIPLALVQHIADGFAAGLIKWLAESSGQQVIAAGRATPVESGRVYMAPDSACLEFGYGHTIRSVAAEPGELTPSIDRALCSAARVFGREALGVVMTGMGRDGQEGVRALMAAGAPSLVQSPETCAVSSMPMAAIETGGVSCALSPNELCDYLNHRL